MINYNWTIIILIILGACIMARSVVLTQSIFSIADEVKFRRAWRNLAILMSLFFVGYLGAAALVFFNYDNLLAYLSGVIFFFGAVFVYLVVNTGLETLKALQQANQNLEKKVVLRTSQLLEKNKELENFVSLVSHDLKEPARTVKSFAQILSKNMGKNSPEQTTTYLDFITNSSGRMLSIIEELLNLSKLGRNLEFKTVDCNQLIKDIQLDLSLKIAENKAEIIANKLPQLQASPLELRMVFQNLIENGIKFKAKEQVPKIHISAFQKEEFWEFQVQDNGIGIEKNHFDKIFQIFKRLPTEIEVEGTGIGLAHCKKIIEAHGGKIWLTSEPNQGTTFYFTLPKAADTNNTNDIQ